MRVEKRTKNVLLAAVIMIGASSLGGCSPGNKESEPSIVVETENITEAIQTESPETEPVMIMPTLDEIRSQISEPAQAGQICYRIGEAGQPLHEGTLEYTFDGSALIANKIDSKTEGIYEGNGTFLVQKKGFWEESTGDLSDPMQVFEQEADEDTVEFLEDITAGDISFYHFRLKADIEPGLLLGICRMEGLEDLVGDQTVYDFYMDKDTGCLASCRIFMTVSGFDRGNQVNMPVRVDIIPATVSDISPVIIPEVTPADDYAGGTINTDANMYENEWFDLKIPGNDLFVFDVKRTEELQKTYTDSDSSYTQEAYAQGDNSIVNILSTRITPSDTRDAVLNRFMTASRAVQAQTSGIRDVGAMSYVCCNARIGESDTKTYCTIAGTRALLITIYYKTDDVPDLFENGCMFEYAQDPLWKPETWTLDTRYEVETPQGYALVKEQSRDLYVCMVSAKYEVNLFSLHNASVDGEEVRETVGDDDTYREIVSREDVPLTGPFTSMRYLVVHCQEADIDYYTYIGLIPTDTGVLKFYAVRPVNDMDYKQVYCDFATNDITVLPTPEPVTEAG